MVPYFTVRVTCHGGYLYRSLLRDIYCFFRYSWNYDFFGTYSSRPFDIGSAKMAEELMLHGESLLFTNRYGCFSSFKVTVNNSVQLRMMVEGKELPIGNLLIQNHGGHSIELMDRMVLLGL